MSKIILIICALITPLSTEAAGPSRRSVIDYGEKLLEQKADAHRQNAINASIITYKTKLVPLLGYSFQYPERWNVTFAEDGTSTHSRVKTADEDYAAIRDEQYKEGHVVFIYSRNVGHKATLEDAWAEWNNIKRQPDHDNVYEYSTLSYIRELDNLIETETTYKGKPALELEFTFSNWSKFWKSHTLMFPRGDRIYTIKYRSEMGHEERFEHVYQHILHTFAFLTPEEDDEEETSEATFSDVPTTHRYGKAIGRMKQLGIVRGYADGSFKPSSTINRAEFIKIITSEPLVPASELEQCTSTNFSDVPEDAWYAPHVCVGVARNMINGYPDGTFRPSNTITFVEAAKIIAAFFGESGETDGAWYVPFVRSLEHRRAIPTSIAHLSSPLTRSEMAEILYRLYDEVEGESKALEDILQ